MGYGREQELVPGLVSFSCSTSTPAVGRPTPGPLHIMSDIFKLKWSDYATRFISSAKNLIKLHIRRPFVGGSLTTSERSSDMKYRIKQ